MNVTKIIKVYKREEKSRRQARIDVGGDWGICGSTKFMLMLKTKEETWLNFLSSNLPCSCCSRRSLLCFSLVEMPNKFSPIFAVYSRVVVGARARRKHNTTANYMTMVQLWGQQTTSRDSWTVCCSNSLMTFELFSPLYTMTDIRFFFAVVQKLQVTWGKAADWVDWRWRR